jgi:hypothetical protein
MMSTSSNDPVIPSPLAIIRSVRNRIVPLILVHLGSQAPFELHLLRDLLQDIFLGLFVVIIIEFLGVEVRLVTWTDTDSGSASGCKESRRCFIASGAIGCRASGDRTAITIPKIITLAIPIAIAMTTTPSDEMLCVSQDSS